MTDCTYCGCDVKTHDPVVVSKGLGGDVVGWFCNYGCLAAHIEQRGLATGTTCRVDP
jgi:hypothetical protein